MTDELVRETLAETIVCEIWPLVGKDDFETHKAITAAVEKVIAYFALSTEPAAYEVERAFLETREFLGVIEAGICDWSCPTTWKTGEEPPHSKLHDDLKAVLFKWEHVRDRLTGRPPIAAMRSQPSPDVDALVEALTTCRGQFAFYVEQHAMKTPPDTAKAATNQRFVDLCDNALSTIKGDVK